MSQGKTEKNCKSTFCWSREVITHLIHLYEQHPNLYTVREKDYHNKNIRQISLENICQGVNNAFLTTLKVADVLKKIHGLRTTYFNELNKIKKSKASGASTDEVYIPKWQYFDLLHFLNDTAAVIHEGDSNLIEQNEEEGEEEILFDGTVEDLNEMSTPTSSQSESRSSSTTEANRKNKQKTKNMETNSQITNLISSATTVLQEISSNKNRSSDRNHIFGKMLAAEMDDIDNEEILDHVKQEIMILLFNAKRQKRQQ